MAVVDRELKKSSNEAFFDNCKIIATGVWLSFGTFFGITTGSLGNFLSCVAVAIFFYLPEVSKLLTESQNKFINACAKVLDWAFIIVILLCLLTGIESIFFAKSNVYPKFLAKEISFGNIDNYANKLDVNGNVVCPNDPIIISEKKNGYFGRCGSSIFSGTYYIKNFAEEVK
jgi:hypothetical protein